jgi:hypothetical protein
MKIIEQTEARLSFKIGIPLLCWTGCDLDRTTGRARIRRVMFFWPRKTVDIPLGDIHAVSLVGAGDNSGWQYPMVTLNSGERIKFAVHQYSRSRKAVDAVGAFLEQGSPTSGPGA